MNADTRKGKEEIRVHPRASAVRSLVTLSHLAPDDELHFDAEGATGETIQEAGQHQGVRVRFAACLGTAIGHRPRHLFDKNQQSPYN